VSATDTLTEPAPTTASTGSTDAPVRLRDGRVVHLRIGPISARIHGRAVVVSLVGSALVLFGMAWSISVGEFPIPFGEVVGELTGLGGGSDSDFIIGTLRLPRVLTGVLVGVAFGVSGQIFQRMARNPLASPDILGITAGASAGAVACIVVFATATITVTGAALGGAMLTILAIYLLAMRNGLSSYRLVLVGIGMTAMLQAVTAYLLTRAELRDAQKATVWLTGSLNGRSWEYVRPLTLVLVVLVPVALVCGRSLRMLEMGDDAAAGLGVSLRRSKGALAAVGAALAAVATAAAGPVAFVALVAPQIARRLVGERTAGLVPAGVVGAAMVVFGDLLARSLFAPTELPVGAVTAFIGAPYLLWLLARANRIGAGG
jgi:iron complex transport system permease protein